MAGNAPALPAVAHETVMHNRLGRAIAVMHCWWQFVKNYKFYFMNCQEIETILNNLKVDSLGRIRGKNKAIDKLHSEHLKKIDSDMMDIRVYVAKMSTGYSTTEALKMIDEFIYRKQVS